MTQTTTDLLHRYGLPGHMAGSHRETESVLIPIVAQVTTLTIDPDPTIAGDYTFTFPIAPGLNVKFTFEGTGQAAAVFATDLAAAMAADPSTSHLVTPVANGVTVELTYRDASRTFALPTIVQPVGGNVTAAVTTQAGGTAMRMGVLYAFGALQTGKGGVTPTPRGARPARPLQAGDTVDDIRGMIAREVNSQTLSPTFNDGTQPDQYSPGHEPPGLLRGYGDAVVDPASGPLTQESDVYAVLAAGTYSVIGSVADAADGANTVLISGGANPLARVHALSQDLQVGSLSMRTVRLKLNRTN